MEPSFEHKLFKYLGIAVGLFYLGFLFKQYFATNAPLLAAPIHVFTALALVFIYKPLSPANKNLKWPSFALDLAMIVASLFIAYYYASETMRIQSRIEFIDEIMPGDRFAFIAGCLMMLEGVRRTTGWSLLIVIIGFILYGFFGYVIPGWVGFTGFSLDEMTEIITLSTSGIFGVTASTSINFLFYFAFFGAVFAATGGGQIFIDLAMFFAGRLKGGSAKAAVIASSLFGTISGSAVANVTTTGVFTIPLMRKTGYSAEQAAATEALASTGGQLMPPIMGVAAFVMAELLGVPYSRIALAGIIPALGFYFAVFMIIDLEARKNNRVATETEETAKVTLKPRLHLLLPPIALVVALMMGLSAPLSALIGAAAAFVAPFLRKETHYGPKEFFEMFVDTAKQVAMISIPLAAVGIIMGVAMQSNIAMKFVSQLAEIGAENLYLSLTMVIVGCLIMGMGLPTVAAYIIGSVMFVPALVNLGVDRLAAHFFVMYYSVLSMVTPPVALATFTAAGLARSNVNKTGMVAFGMSFVVFLIPFGFVTDPAILWEGSWHEISIAMIGMVAATLGWAVVIQGWLGSTTNLIERAAFAVLSIYLVLAPSQAALWKVGLGAFVLLCAWQMFLKPRLFPIKVATLQQAE